MSVTTAAPLPAIAQKVSREAWVMRAGIILLVAWLLLSRQRRTESSDS